MVPPTSKVDMRKNLRVRRARHVAQTGSNSPPEIVQKLARTVRNAPVAGYLASPNELDCLRALHFMATSGALLALPHLADGMMTFRLWHPGDALVPGPHGISQPIDSATEVEPTTILAPLVAFDRTGARLGQGGGHYDRAFARFPKARRIGLAFACQEVEAVPMDPWDMRLQIIITEREIIRT